MFLLMGSIANNSGISSSLFRAARAWFGGMPGGLAVADEHRLRGIRRRVRLERGRGRRDGAARHPEMLKNGYDKGLATGVVASAGTLAALIPPSILFVLYGIFAEVSIVKLLIAGICPAF